MKGAMRKRGANSWELRVEMPRDSATGKRRVQYVSFRGGKRQAQVKLAELVAAVAKGKFIEPSKLTVAEHLRDRVGQWESAGSISARTAQRYRQLIENQIVPHLGARILQKLKPLDLEAWHTVLRTVGRRRGTGGISSRTIGHAHRVLGKALEEAAKNDLLNRNPAMVQRAPKVEAKEMTILVGDEVGTIIKKLRGHAMYAPAIVALFTGMRLGEILALRWANVDIESAKMIYVREALEETTALGIRSKTPKTKAGRRDITLPDIVVDALRDHRQQQLELRLKLGLGRGTDDALVFPAHAGGPWATSAASRAWGLAAAGIGMGNVTFHSLRHTHASQLIDAAVDVVTISRRLGHANPNVTLAIYAHLFRKDDSKASAAINALTNLGRSW